MANVANSSGGTLGVYFVGSVAGCAADYMSGPYLIPPGGSTVTIASSIVCGTGTVTWQMYVGSGANPSSSGCTLLSTGGFTACGGTQSDNGPSCTAWTGSFSATCTPPPTYLECCSPPMYWTNTSAEWLSLGVSASGGAGTCFVFGEPGLSTWKIAPGGSVQFPAGTFCETDCCPVVSWQLNFYDATLGFSISNLPVGIGPITTNSSPPFPVSGPVGTGPTQPGPGGGGGGLGAGGGTNTPPGIGAATNLATIGSIIGVQTAILGVGQNLAGLLSASNTMLGTYDGLTGFYGSPSGSNMLNAFARSNVWVVNQTNLELWESNAVWAITSAPPDWKWGTTQAVAGNNGAAQWSGLAGDTNLSSFTNVAYHYGTNFGNALTNFGLGAANEAVSEGTAFGSLVGSDSSGAGDLSYGVFGTIHWDNVFNGSVLDNPSLAWTPGVGFVRGPDLTAISGIKNLMSLFISWAICLGCLLWYGDAVRDAVVEAISGQGIQVSGTAAGVAGQIPGVTLSLRALLTLAVVALLVFFPTVLTASMGSVAYALGWSGTGDVVAAVTSAATSKSPFSSFWPSSVTRIWGVLAVWLPMGLMIIAGVNLVAARFTFMWRIPMYVFISRLLWSI